MIPLSDSGRAGRGLPYVTIGLIAVSAIVFLLQVSQPEREQIMTTYQFATIPAELTSGIDRPPLNPFPLWTTIFSSMFMHGGWSHIIGNMVYLWIFGDNIEDVLGRMPYLAFYLVCGVAADAAHILSDPTSSIPTLGASGAISGVLGAYLVLFPTNKVDVLLTLGYFWRRVSLPAVFVLGGWIALQLFSGAIEPTVQGGGVAYWAHIGGFAAGMLLILPVRLLRGDLSQR